MQPSLIETQGSLTYRIIEGQKDHHPILLIHGYGGDEDAMWALQAGIPSGGLVIAPRGPFPTGDGGYSWVEKRGKQLSTLVDFEEGAALASEWLEELIRQRGLSASSLLYMGFSQGAAMAFALGSRTHFRPAGIISLAGFLPDGDFGLLRGMQIFWAHGTRDDQVPVDRARQDIAILEDYATTVEYCEEETGHKVGVACMRNLKQWLTDHGRVESRGFGLHPARKSGGESML